MNWEYAVRSASPEALREVGNRCARAAIRALQAGDPEASVRAMRRVAPEFRAPILYALDVEAALERLAS